MTRVPSLALAATLLLFGATAASARADFRVTRTDDPAPGACSPGDCSLREAVAASNANGGGTDEVRVGPGRYRLARGELAVTGGLRLVGSGARRTTVDGGGGRILHVRPGASAAVEVASLALQGANLQSADGGAIFLEDRGSTLEVRRASISLNRAVHGAGIRADGPIDVAASIFFGNQALGGAAGDGAAIAFRGAGRGRIVNTTFGNNHGPDRGGAIDFSPSVSSSLTLLNDTVADNHSDRLGGGIAAGGAGKVLLKNTIVARNTVNAGGHGRNCRGRVRSLGHNLEDGRTCGRRRGGDIRGPDPALGRTRNNGGPTDTRELLRRSKAINRGTNSGCPRTDQRGVRRPKGRRCDIGAFEFNPRGGRHH
jgi:large repetitive protein